MAIASGVPVPQVYVMDEEDGINAFAAGHKPGDATVTVTRGCMKLLSRDELQGVIGHEFSHILNGDMRLNLRLMGTIFGILCLAIVGRILLQTARGGGRSRGQNPLPLLGTRAAGSSATSAFFLGGSFKLPSAASANFSPTPRPSSSRAIRQGITGALKKIGGLGETGSRLSHAHAEELSHMFFGNGVSEPFIGLLETHPPLSDRIRVFDPNFDGKFPSSVTTAATSRLRKFQSRTAAGAKPFRHRGRRRNSRFRRRSKPPVIRSHSVLPNLGNPQRRCIWNTPRNCAMRCQTV
jgi:hypothetical protein